MSTHVSEAMSLLQQWETARLEKLALAKGIYAEAILSGRPPAAGMAALVEAMDQLGVSAAEMRVDAGVAEALRINETELAVVEDSIAALEEQIGKIVSELGKLNPSDRDVGTLQSRHLELEDEKRHRQHYMGIVEFPMRHTAWRSPRVFGGNFRMLAARVRAARHQAAITAAAQKAADAAIAANEDEATTARGRRNQTSS